MISKQEYDEFESLRREYLCAFFDEHFQCGDTCEYEILPEHWVQCLLLQTRRDRPYDFWASYLDLTGKHREGIVRRSKLRKAA